MKSQCLLCKKEFNKGDLHITKHDDGSATMLCKKCKKAKDKAHKAFMAWQFKGKDLRTHY